MLTVLIGLLVGLALGLTGGGGSIIAVPALVYLLGLAPLEAASLSLMVVMAVSLVGTLQLVRSGMIEFRAGLLMAITGICLAPVGVYVAGFLSDTGLMLGFSLLMLVVAGLMAARAFLQPDEVAIVRSTVQVPVDASGAICRLRNNQTLSLSTPCSIVLAVLGGLTGFLSGMFGVGGGFIIVPALTSISKLSIHRAVASSLFIIVLVSGSGMITAIQQDRLQINSLTLLFLAGGVAGMLIGRLLAEKLSAVRLQKLFAVSVAILGAVSLVLNF